MTHGRDRGCQKPPLISQGPCEEGTAVAWEKEQTQELWDPVAEEVWAAWCPAGAWLNSSLTYPVCRV